MSNGGSSQPRPTRNDRREAAREKARLLREEQKKRDRRKKVIVQSSVIVGVVAVAGLIAFLIFQGIKPAGPGPRNMASDGIVLQGVDGVITAVETPALQPGDDPVPTEQDQSGDVANIVTYLDYLCPYCGQFESTNSETMRTLVESGAATLEVHPIAILTNKSAGTQYSLRAANAAGCVADSSPEAFFDFNEILFENQPEEGSTGLTNDQLKELAAEAGASSQVNACIDEVRFKAWVLDSTERALSGPIPNAEIPAVTGTPTVLVNGKSYGGSLTDAAEFQAFVTQAASESSLESTDDPSATPTPTPTPAQ
ncbi:thioredoxin domain-containing protein [Agromyces sp. CFH 90414]|uniref:Thioredoxin domain-containing protein n=1 Tax=Agromyces agglutinans TaxID=2662258 RepID=A0A6I2F9X2_9MICO|nr:thioredoxin domain-containing protein [Agromyces agglutinans]MRG61024.1 thioredoxin domain-containing protein [Agromyces agglutinans]